MVNVTTDQLSGFQSQKQLNMYLEFAGRALELMQQEIMSKLLGTAVFPFDQETWQKKLGKCHKALVLMERHKV